MEKSWKFSRLLSRPGPRLWVSRPRSRLYCLSSRCLETKTLVSRTTSLRNAQNAFAVRVLPRTPLGSFTALSRPPNIDWGSGEKRKSLPTDLYYFSEIVASQSGSQKWPFANCHSKLFLPLSLIHLLRTTTGCEQHKMNMNTTRIVVDIYFSSAVLLYSIEAGLFIQFIRNTFCYYSVIVIAKTINNDSLYWVLVDDSANNWYKYAYSQKLSVGNRYLYNKTLVDVIIDYKQ